jgi:Family of unknown function (DUF5706)
MMAAREVLQQATEVDDKTVEVAVALFEHVEDQINRTDTKAQVVLAADALLLGWFGTQNPTAMQALLDGHASAVAQVTALLIALVFVGLFLSLTCGLLVIWPRTGGPGGSSLVYFGGIARRSEGEFVAAFLRQSRVEVAQNVLAGVHAKARIAQQKFRWVSLSVAFLLATVVVWTVLQVIRLALS